MLMKKSNDISSVVLEMTKYPGRSARFIAEHGAPVAQWRKGLLIIITGIACEAMAVRTLFRHFPHDIGASLVMGSAFASGRLSTVSLVTFPVRT